MGKEKSLRRWAQLTITITIITITIIITLTLTLTIIIIGSSAITGTITTPPRDL